MVKHRVPNIVRGGIALPLDKTDYYLVRGRKHEQGGIDIGKNPRTGLEVEDGEVVHVGDKELRVFSAEPILGGVSPSQLVMRGANPDKVFAAQERFKQVNGIKDDGTKAPFGTLKKLIFGVDFKDIKTSDGRGYNPAYIERAYSSLKKSGLTKKQQAVVLANIIEESGGDPFALNKNSGKDYGTLQWVDRYPKSNETDPYKEIDNQMGYFLNTINNLDDQVSWTHGGKGSGYQSRKDAYNDFNSDNIEAINRGFVLGHVRPAGKYASAKNRIGVAEQIYDRIKRLGGNKPYTTKLNPKEEFEFRQWYKKLADKKGLNPDYDAEEHYYDYRGFWKNEDRYGILNDNPNVHFTDRYKKPGHPTFSNESIYSKGNTIGGNWIQDKDGNWLFNHSEYTKQYKDKTKDYLRGTGEGYIINGDTIIDKKRFGGDTDEDKYIKQKADSVIQAALHKSRTRKNVEVPLIDNPNYDRDLQHAYEVMIIAQNDTRDPNFNPDYNKSAAANYSASVYYDMLNHPNKMVGATCMYNASDCYGKEHRVPGNQIFKENPKKYGFKKININDAKEGDIVQHIDINGVPQHAMIINDAKDKNHLKFNYTTGPAIVINGNYPLDKYNSFDAYRFVGSPQDSVKWKNEYHRLNKKRLGGNMKHNLVEVNIGGSSKLIRVAKPSSTGESERSEGLTRKRAVMGTEKEEDTRTKGSLFGESLLNETPLSIAAMPNTIRYIKDNLTPDLSIPKININKPAVKLNGKQKLIKTVGAGLKSGIIGDAIGIGTNIIGGITSNILNRKMLNSLEFPKAPIPYQATKLKTKININPQLDAMRESLADYERSIAGNTASSRVALARTNNIRNKVIRDINQIHGQKENIETQLINTDRQNQQSINNKNIEAINTYNTNKVNFENKIRELKAENNVDLIQNISQGVQDLLARRESRGVFNRNLMAQTFANPNLPAELYYASGIWPEEVYNMYRKQYPR